MQREPELTPDAAAVRVAFLKRYLDDQNRGAPQPLAAYQALFPGFESLVAREHARLGSAAGTESDAADPSAAPARRDPQDEVDGFVLIEVLGQGGMGTVYRARQLGPLEREVALKVVKLGMDTREVTARFEAERQTLARLDHPNIARVYEARMTRSGRPAFSMELVHGATLTAHCDRHRLRVAERLHLFLAVCDAVEHAHRKGIVHRDLKPSNVLVVEVDGRPAPKVIDFGIAKTLHASANDAARTEVGQVLGTLEYMPPEQADLGGIDVDTRADVYALGVVLYELLTGAPPFDSLRLRERGLTEALRQIAEVEPPRPSTRLRKLGDTSAAVAANRGCDPRTLARALSNDLDWITARAMAKERERRYQDVAELGADIRRHLAHLPVLAGPPGLAYRARKLCRRHRGKLIAAAVVAVLALASAALAFQETRRDRTRRARERLDSATAALAAFHRAQADTRSRETAWRSAASARQGWEPPWTLSADIEAWRIWQAALDGLPTFHNQAVLALHQAREAALPGSVEESRALQTLSDLHWQRFQDVYWQGGEAMRPEYVASNVALLGDPRYSRLLELSGSVEIDSDPPGAEVHCFRHELVEGRLLPLPQSLDGGILRPAGEPALIVERIWDRDGGAGPPPLEPGDRVLTAGGRPVRLLGDLVAVINALPAAAQIDVEVLRGGKETGFFWRPRDAGGRGAVETLDDLRKLLGVTFQAYPLEVGAVPPLGVTTAAGAFGLELPRGSYLFVLRKPGHLDTRLPVSVPLPPELAHGRLSARLFRPDQVPAGYVHVPGGWFPAGGDPDSDASLDARRELVGDFFMARHEVSFGEYLEFVRDLDRSGRLEVDGESAAVAPRWPAASGAAAIARLVASVESRVPVVPFLDGEPVFVRDSAGAWRQAKGTSEHPVCGVSALAALEYALWLGDTHGGRFRFRLPTDLEWEKAARGADRRFHVWGDYPVPSFCVSSNAFAGPSRFLPRGAAPFDESVHGVRDLAGSLCEPTASWKEKRFLSIRGGDWFQATGYYIRAANRNGHLPERVSKFQGVRLVADAPAP